MNSLLSCAKHKDSPILFIGSNRIESLERMYLRAFAKIGYTRVDLFDIQNWKPRILKNRYINRLSYGTHDYFAGHSLMNFLKTRKGHYKVIIVFKGMELTRRVIERCREITGKAIWVNLNPDDPFNIASRGSSNNDVLESLPCYDVYCIWSKGIAERLRRLGCRHVFYLPFGFDEESHVPPGKSGLAANRTVSFVGTWDKEREEVLTAISSFNLCIYGENWGRVSRKSPLDGKIIKGTVFGPELARIINGSTVSINLLRPQNKGSHNMRTFEIPAMGGLMLTTRSEEQNEFFPEGTASYMFGDVNELKEKITEIFENEAAAGSVRARGRSFVMEHSYTRRAECLMSEIASLGR